MTEKDLLLWREVSLGRYERDIDAAEQFYTTLARTWEGTGHTYYAITAALDFTVDASSSLIGPEVSNRVISAFWNAWKKLRYQFPTLAAEVIYEEAEKKCKKVYQSPESEEEVQKWMRDTFIISQDYKYGGELANEDLPLRRFASLHLLRTHPILFEDSKSGDQYLNKVSMLFRARHDIIDGVGTLMLVNYLFKYASEFWATTSTEQLIKFGDEYKRLSPPLEVAASLIPPTAQQLGDVAAIHAANTAAVEGCEVVGYPVEITKSVPEKSQQADSNLSAEETAEFLAKCKSKGVTATHVFHAAIAITLGQIQARSQEARKAKYSSYALIDLRNFCKDPLDHPISVPGAVSAKHLFVDLTIPSTSQTGEKVPEQELSLALDQVKEFYKSTLINKDLLATVPIAYQSFTPPYPVMVPPIPPPNPDRRVSLSSVGLIDKLLQPKQGPFKIYNPWGIGAEYSAGIGLFLGTFDGKLQLWAAYNEAFHTKESVVEFLKKVEGIAWDILDAGGEST